MIDNYILRSIKEVSLPKLLADFGIHPEPERSLDSRYLTYLATYRGERHPSVSVFQKTGELQWLYRDHTTGEVGTNLDLLVRFGFFRDWREAAIYVADKHLGVQIENTRAIEPRFPSAIPRHVHPTPISCNAGVILGTQSIVGSIAEKYIRDNRKIPISVAAEYVYYARYSHHPNGRVFSGIAWPTLRGGTSIRWPRDLGPGRGKTFVGPGGISFFPLVDGIQSETCAVFEGIFDHLTFVTLHGKSCDSIVLNSVANINEALNILRSYPRIIGYLDADREGRSCWKTIVRQFGDRTIDASCEFTGHKDYNDYLKHCVC